LLWRGTIPWLLLELSEAGYDIIDPVQSNISEMNPNALKREFT